MVASPMVAPQPAAQRAVVAREPLDLEARLVVRVRAPVALRRALAREAGAVDRRAREPLGAESDDEERVSVVLRLTPRARARWWSARQVANRVAGHALSHGMFAEVLAAEVLSGVPLEAEVEDANQV